MVHGDFIRASPHSVHRDIADGHSGAAFQFCSYCGHAAFVSSCCCSFTCISTSIHPESPSLALGVPIPSGWLIPHTDPNIAPESRGFAFAKWVSSYFIHGDLSNHDIDSLTYTNTDPSKSATVETLSPEDLFAMTDFGPAEKYDNIIGLPPFAGAVFKQTNKALFDPTVRAAWSQTRFWTLYGSAEPWPIIYGAWFLEAQSHEMNNAELAIEFKVIDGSNHFVRLPTAFFFLSFKFLYVSRSSFGRTPRRPSTN
jgi:hypothetical protein